MALNWGDLSLMKRNYVLGLVTVCFALFAANSFEAPINYGDFSDIPPGAVMYTDVTESSGTDPVPPPLYGPPELEINTLDFDPVGFVATSSGGPLDIVDGQLNFGIEMAPGSGLSSLFLSEGGDYSFGGFDGAGTTVSAGAIIRVEIQEVDGAALTTPIVVTASSSFFTDMAATGGATPGPLPWGLGVFVDFGPVLPLDSLVTKAEVVINNQLITNSEEDSLAFIAKKEFELIPGGDLDPDDVIPEPTSLALVTCCLVGLAARRRRNG